MIFNLIIVLNETLIHDDSLMNSSQVKRGNKIAKYCNVDLAVMSNLRHFVPATNCSRIFGRF